MTPRDQGSFPLTGTGALPNVTRSFPGEHWTKHKAGEAITPGAAIVPVVASGVKRWRTAISSDPATQLAIAMRTVQIPDPNTGPTAKSPNAIMNTEIAVDEYVSAEYSGGFALTLVVPGEYEEADLIGWDADGVRPAGKSGTGAWAKNSAADIDSIFEVQKVREVGENDEVILNVRHLRGQSF